MSNKIANEYRPTMNRDVLLSWSKDAIEELKLKLSESNANHEKINSLISEFRPTIPEEVNHLWAEDVVDVLDNN
tara:strand:+ start:10377 stop:10598 length:222 start_codon:yes stop_codon:yes gene_type:complete